MEIPSKLSDLTLEWASSIWKKPFQGFFVHPLSNRDGFCDVARVSSDSFAWMVSLVPEDEELRLTIKKHGLFLKELSFYKVIKPLISKHVSQHLSEGKKWDLFRIPTYVDGEYDAESGRGFLVLEDFMEKGYKVDDPSLLLLNSSHIFRLIRQLGTFHGICSAYYALLPNADFGEAHLTQESTWFQEDMAPVLKEMYWTCLSFFQSVPGEEDLCKWFEAKMANPLEYHRNRSTKIKSLVHGDFWHNNIYFNRDNESLVHDWQMIHWGPATDDLCFLLFSSTTACWRRNNWYSAITAYYESFSSVVKAVGVSFEDINLSFENFMDDIRASIPLSIFFCGNVRDLQLEEEFPLITDDESEFISMNISSDSSSSSTSGEPTSPIVKTNISLSSHSSEEQDDSTKQQQTQPKLLLLERRGLKKIPTIASHRELCKLEKLKEEGKKIGDITPKEARAMRRKLYLDLYREASSTHYI
uniref:CHK kinase-like domain-containing protein n=1 Tax=Lepeophtheirus salmonis TaxID=72036 RepID=A0A0K2V6W4_LEPSM